MESRGADTFLRSDVWWDPRRIDPYVEGTVRIPGSLQYTNNPYEPLYERGVSYPMTIVGVIASLLLAAGLLPPYYEIWKRRGRVVGINWVRMISHYRLLVANRWRIR